MHLYTKGESISFKKNVKKLRKSLVGCMSGFLDACPTSNRKIKQDSIDKYNISVPFIKIKHFKTRYTIKYLGLIKSG